MGRATWQSAEMEVEGYVLENDPALWNARLKIMCEPKLLMSSLTLLEVKESTFLPSLSSCSRPEDPDEQRGV